MREDEWEWPERAACPACGSRETTLLVIGEMVGPLPEASPQWAVPVGCIDEGVDWECDECHFRWANR
jgi:hypothetical protein